MIRSKCLFFTIFFGVFSVMALSNVIIPVLPDLHVDIRMQAFIFSAYFFGAMVTTLPGGMISDRVGQVPVIGCSLILTIITGCFLIITSEPVSILIIRLIEGIGAGLFISAALSWVNHQVDHVRLSGLFMALLNFGLLLGLICGGWISGVQGFLSGGVIIFTALTIIALFTFFMYFFAERKRNVIGESVGTKDHINGIGDLIQDTWGMLIREAPLWYSVIILLGIGGFVQALYPDLSNLSATDISVALAGMNFATIIASLMAPRFRLEPVLLIRVSAILMGIFVLVFIQYPLSIFLMGFASGFIMIAQINYLAVAEENQGVAMGLFSTSSYAGMTLIPAIGGYISGMLSISIAAFFIAIMAFICAICIGWCKCRGFTIPVE